MKRLRLVLFAFVSALSSCATPLPEEQSSLPLADPYPEGVSYSFAFGDYAIFRDKKGGRIERNGETLLEVDDASFSAEEAERIYASGQALPFAELLERIGFPRYVGMPGAPYLDFGEEDGDIYRLRLSSTREERYLLYDFPLAARERAPLSYRAPCHHVDPDAGPFEKASAEALRLGASIDQTIALLGRPCRYEGNVEPWYEFDLGEGGVMRAHYSLVEEEGGRGRFRLDEKVFDDEFLFRLREEAPMVAPLYLDKQKELLSFAGDFAYGDTRLCYRSSAEATLEKGGRPLGTIASRPEALEEAAQGIPSGMNVADVFLRLGVPFLPQTRNGRALYFGEAPRPGSSMPAKILVVDFDEAWNVKGTPSWRCGFNLAHYVDPSAPKTDVAPLEDGRMIVSLPGFLLQHPFPHRYIRSDSAILEYDLPDGRIYQTRWDVLPLCDDARLSKGRAIHALVDERFLDPIEG